MTLKRSGKIAFIILIFITLLVFTYSKFFKEKKTIQIEPIEKEGEVYSSNIIKNVKYTTKDDEGNEYTITASEAEIDLSLIHI